VTLAGSKVDSSKFYDCEKSENFIAFLLYVGYIMAKHQSPYVKNGLDTSQNKAVNLGG
jgi:hypothetical protein